MHRGRIVRTTAKFLLAACLLFSLLLQLKQN